MVNQNKSRSTKPVEILINGQLISDKAQVASQFCNYFSTMVTDKLDSHFQGDLSHSCTISNRIMVSSIFIDSISRIEVLNIINSLCNKKSTGYDEIPAFVVKRCGDMFAGPISHIFNLSIQSGHFPDALRTAIVVPVPKRGDPSDLSNYRPIALLSVISKFLEKIMVGKVCDFLESHRLLDGFQHGFRSGFSTESAMVELVQCVNDKIDQDMFVVLVSFDLSRAFDTVHPLFVSEKIDRLGIRGPVNSWLVSFLLTNRKYIVKINNSKSQPYTSEIGCPQGSVLAPLIFLLYLNDLPELPTRLRLFLWKHAFYSVLDFVEGMSDYVAHCLYLLSMFVMYSFLFK